VAFFLSLLWEEDQPTFGPQCQCAGPGKRGIGRLELLWSKQLVGI